METLFLKKKKNAILGIFKHITVRALVAPVRYADFIGTCFTGWTDVIVVRYSAITNGVPSINGFRFQRNAVNVSRI
jgi:hypothetical protein